MRKTTAKQLRELIREANLFASRRNARAARKVLKEIKRKLAELENRLGVVGRPGLQTIDRAIQLEHLIVQYLKIALDDDYGTEKPLVSTVLARLYVRLLKHHRKLTEVNPWYRETVRKLGKIRADVLLPESPVGQVLQEELRTAEHYRSKLLALRELFEQQPLKYVVTVDRALFEERKRNELVLQVLATGSGWVYGTAKGRPRVHLFSDKGIRAIEKRAREAMPSIICPQEVAEKHRSTWEDMATARNIPEAYWPLAYFPDLSLESSEKWWAFVWSRIKKRDKLLSRLRERGKGRAGAKNQGVLYLKDFQKEFRKHWQTLVRLRMAGIF